MKKNLARNARLVLALAAAFAACMSPGATAQASMPTVAPVFDSSYDGLFKSECESGWTGSGPTDGNGFKEAPDWAQPWYLSSCINAGDWQTLDSISALQTIQLQSWTVTYGYVVGQSGALKWIGLEGGGLGDTTTLPAGYTQARWSRYTNGQAIVNGSNQVIGHSPPGWYLQVFQSSPSGWFSAYEQPGTSGWSYPAWSSNYDTYANSTPTLAGIHRYDLGPCCSVGGAFDPNSPHMIAVGIPYAEMPFHLYPYTGLETYTNQGVSFGSTAPAWNGASFRSYMQTTSPDWQRILNNAADPSDYPLPGATQTYGSCADGSIHANDPSACIGAVDTATGAYTSSATDVALPGIGLPFVFTRTYTSADVAPTRLGKGWRDSYSASLNVQPNGDVSLVAENGQQVYYTKQPDGSFVPLAGGTSTLAAVSGGYELVTHDQIHYHFNTSGVLQSMTDRNGEGISFSYDASGCLSSANDSAGRSITFTCSGGLLTKITLPDTRHVDFAYTNGLLTSVTDMGGGVWTYTYDASNRLATIVDPNNHTVTSNTYGSDGRITQRLDGLGKTTTYAWDPVAQTATTTDPRGKIWKDVYASNILVSRTDPLGHTVTFDVDGQLNAYKQTDANGNTTTSTYDSRGNMLTRTGPAPSSVQESWTYDSLNDVLTHTNGRGNQTSYGYDSHGNLTTKTEPGTIVTLYGRDPAGTGLLVSQTDPRGKVTTFGYDSAGNLTSTTSPAGEETTMSYDSDGRMIGRVDPRGNVSGANPNDYKTTFAYDTLDRKTSQTDPLGDQRQWAYDPVGNLTSATDANSNVTSYTYDADNHLLTVTAPGPATTTYQYDANGNLTKRTDANTHVTTYSYDDANHLQSVVTPLNATWQYTYDANGNRTKTISPRGTTTFTYDELNRLKTVGYSDSTPGVSFTYDANNNRSQMTDGAGTVNYVYDALDRLTSATRGTDAFTYSYDAASNLTERVYPGGTTTDYTYDDDERPVSVTSSSATTSYAYDPASELITTTRPASNGWNDTRTYDHAGRLTEILDSNGTDTLQKLDYGYDANGNQTSLTRLIGSENYQYDNRNRLTKVCYDNPCATATDYIAWTYDGVGNRLTETRPAGTTNYTYNNGDQLTQTSGPSGTTSYGYDSDGNQTSSGSTTYTYDLAERLTGATVGTTATAYAYDGDGNRLTETTGSTATSLLWDTNSALPQLAVERDSNTNALRTYIQGLSGTVSMLEGAATFYFHIDRLGSIAALTSSNGTKEWSYSYEPFGTPRATNKIDPNAPVNPLGYVGQYDDPATSLLDLRARQYDPTTGRFLSTDPTPAGPTSPFESAYDYAGQDPINSYDLDGTLRGPIGTYFNRDTLAGMCSWDPGYCPAGGSINVGAIGHYVATHKTQIGLALIVAGASLATMGAGIEVAATVAALTRGGAAALAEGGAAPVVTPGSALVIGGAGTALGGLKVLESGLKSQTPKPLGPKRKLKATPR